MISLYFMKDIPFYEVFINPLVNDSKGQKMSKSKGNVVDPVELIDKYGCDVLRFTLASLTTPGRNLLLGDEKIEGSRNFANKIWNASKFVISSLSGFEEDIKKTRLNDLELNIWDKWILEKLNTTIRGFENILRSLILRLLPGLFINFSGASFATGISKFQKTGFTAVTFRIKKHRHLVLHYVLENYLRIIHPIMPFLTEAVWQIIPHEGESIMIMDFPKPQKKFLSKKESADINILLEQ